MEQAHENIETKMTRDVYQMNLNFTQKRCMIGSLSCVGNGY